MLEVLTVDEVLAIFRAAGPTSTYAERLQRELNIRLALQQAQRRKDAEMLLRLPRTFREIDNAGVVELEIPITEWEELKAIAEGKDAIGGG